MPLFSILIANYNNGRYLMDAIESVIAQTYSNWEIIILDDGSTDNSYEIYEKLKENERIHIFYNNSNKGCAFTKHQLVLHAKAEYCGYLDPDDVLLPNAIEVTLSALLKHPEAVLSFSRHYICDELLKIKEESRLLELKPGESYFEHHDYRAEVFAGFKKSAYFASGGLDISNRAGVDADLYFRLEEHGDIIILNDFTYMYRRVSQAITGNVNKMMYWNLMVRHKTCQRRGLPVEDYAYKDFLDFIKMNVDLSASQNEQALTSKAYRLGKVLLKPFIVFKRLIHGV